MANKSKNITKKVDYQDRQRLHIAKKGEKIYQKEIKNKVEPQMSGKFLALDIKTKDYFIANNIIQADKKARQKHPEEVFYIKRIGAPATISFRGFRGLALL